MRISQVVDTVFAWIKWPVAAGSVVLLPGACLAAAALVRRVIAEPTPVMTFLAGFAVYAVLWWFMIRWWRASFLSTLEHELTHAVFALLTFHRVTNIRATWSRGGHINFRGKGNWLITTSPYWSPTVCLLLIAVFWVLPAWLRTWFNPALGATLAYHVTSTLRETHGGQTDLKKVGYLFALALLPTANVLTNGLVVAFAHGGLGGMGLFLREMWTATVRVLGLEG